MVSSQQWEGPALTVTYQRQATTEPVATSAAAEPVSASSSIPLGGIAIIVGGVMIAAGAFLPWLTASTGFASVSRNGMEGGDGFIVLIIAAAIILAGVSTRRGGRAWLTALVASVVGVVIGLAEWTSVTDRIAEVVDGAIVQVGIGIYLIVAGAVIGVLASIAVARAQRR